MQVARHEEYDENMPEYIIRLKRVYDDYDAVYAAVSKMVDSLPNSPSAEVESVSEV
ncbi:MAG: hypothetical protein JRN68_03220 [Nitrososphaerota archaeon]|nr:hypothetical protein [Ferrimicrobium acidiphilum]MDG6933688.1 hypothetical protein [Nitrososphaerota archaeon]